MDLFVGLYVLRPLLGSGNSLTELLATQSQGEGGLESGGKDNTKQTNELLLRAL